MDAVMSMLSNTTLTPHRFAIWPTLSGNDYRALRNDIETHGQRLPIITYQGQILDGCARYQACHDLGIPPVTEEFRGDEEAALDLVTSYNDKRRHLSKAQRAFTAARLSEVRRGDIGRGRPIGSSNHGPIASRERAAAALKVSPKALDDAKRIIRDAPELEADIVAGKTTFGAVVKTLREQAAARPSKVKAPTKHLADRVPKVTKWNRTLTREMVDPEFVGDEMAFCRKYGHVWLQTAEEIATSRLHALASTLGVWARHQKQFPIEPIDINWLRSPRAKDVEKLRAAYDVIAPILRQLDDVLAKAEATIKGDDQ